MPHITYNQGINRASSLQLSSAFRAPVLSPESQLFTSEHISHISTEDALAEKMTFQYSIPFVDDPPPPLQRKHGIPVVRRLRT